VPGDTGKYLADNGIKYVLVNLDTFKRRFNESFEQWLAAVNARVLWNMPLTLRASGTPFEWSFVQLDTVTPHPADAWPNPAPTNHAARN
jgi:hypothetical protein